MLVKETLKQLDEKRKKISELKKVEKLLTKLKAEFSSNHIQLSFSLQWEYERIPYFYVYIKNPRDLKDINPIIKFLAKHNYMLKTRPWTVEANAWVVWDFGLIQLIGVFKSNEENACKFVQIGTKDVPIYEIDCPGLNEDFAQEKRRAEGE